MSDQNNRLKRRERLQGVRDAMNQAMGVEMGKLPPQATDLEEAVLGAMMLEQNAVNTVIDILKPESFYKDANARIFDAIRSLFEKGEPIDILTVTQMLRKQGQLEVIGGPLYIAQLTNRVASTANIETHARIVAQKFIQRELIRISNDIIKDSYDETTDVFDLLDKAENNLFQVAEGNIRKNYDKMSALIKKAMAELKFGILSFTQRADMPKLSRVADDNATLGAVEQLRVDGLVQDLGRLDQVGEPRAEHAHITFLLRRAVRAILPIGREVAAPCRDLLAVFLFELLHHRTRVGDDQAG
jgi:hypothetical protein